MNYTDRIIVGMDIYDKCYYGKGIDKLMNKTNSLWSMRMFLRGRSESVP